MRPELILTLLYNVVSGALTVGLVPEGRWKMAAMLLSMVFANALALFFNRVVGPSPTAEPKMALSPPPPKNSTGLLLLPLAFLVALPGCGFCAQAANKDTPRCKAQAVATQCAEPGVIKLVTQVLPVVVLDLIAGNFGAIPTDVLNVLKGQGITDATVVATCAVQLVDGNLSAPSGAALAPESKALKLNAIKCLAGACPWVPR